MQQIEARYRGVTPLFLGGANQAPEFRLASFVNVVRWWWRFLALGRYGGRHTATFWEAVLFGWAGNTFGRKRVSFRIAAPPVAGGPAAWVNDTWLKKNSGLNYLSAQALAERRPLPIQEFAVRARVFRKIGKPTIGVDEDWARAQIDRWDERWPFALDILRDALALVGLLGGLGSRARRGFGSLALTHLSVDGQSHLDGLPADVGDYRETLRSHLGQRPCRQHPPYSAFSSGSSFEVCARGPDARDLMNSIGWAFQVYRSWGQRVNNATAADGHHHRFLPQSANTGPMPAGTRKASWYRGAFRDDHDRFYAARFPTNVFDNRSVFGLPHNYGRDTAVDWEAPSFNHHRRASPLMFHFHQLASGECIFVASVVPADFLPHGANLRVNGHSSGRPDFSATNFDHLKGFLTFVKSGQLSDMYEPVP